MFALILEYLTYSSAPHCCNSSKISMQALIIFISLALTIQIQSQSIITLQTNATKQNPPNQNLTIFNNSKLNYSFVFTEFPFYCSYNPDLYTYRGENSSVNNNTYIVNLTQFGTTNRSGNVSLSIWMKYYILHPFINSMILNQTMNLTYPIENSSQAINSYILQIQNNCPVNTNRFSPNFDVISIKVQNFSENPSSFTFSYWILCQLQSTFQYGLLIIIIFSSIILPIIAVYSNAQSISGRGLKINWIVVLALNSAIIIGGIIGITQFVIAGQIKILTNIILVLSWIAGLMSVWLCCNQSLFQLKRFKLLKKQLYRYRQLTIRVMDIISMAVSLAICCAWFFSGQNYLLSNVIDVCMIIAAIKFFKFTSLKSALICLIATLSVESIFVTAAALYNSTYNTAILNFSSNPFQLLMFTINPVYNQKCAWLPVTALIYPGALMSYMRRFDTSRNTHVYIIICIAMFLVGALLWMLATVLSINQVPFGITVDSFTLLLCSYYAWKRKQMGMLWTGQWYDQQFQHKSELKQVGAALNNQSNMSQVSYKPQLFDQLKIDNTKRVSFLLNSSASDYRASMIKHDGSQNSEKISSDRGKVSINQQLTERQLENAKQQELNELIGEIKTEKQSGTSKFPDNISKKEP